MRQPLFLLRFGIYGSCFDELRPIRVLVRVIRDRISTRITDFLGCNVHTSRTLKRPTGVRENPMEIAAFVVLSSVALWIAEEVHAHRQ